MVIKDQISSYFNHEAKTDTKERLLYAGQGIAMGVLAFLMSGAQLLVGVFPFGVSLLCASSKYVPFMYAGMLTSALFNKGLAVPLFLTWTFAFLLRIAIGFWLKSKCLFTESIYLRLGVGLSSALMMSVYRIIAGGFLYYDMMCAAVEIVFIPVMTLLMSFTFDKAKRYSYFFEIGIASVLFASVFSLRGMHIAGFSLSSIACFLITMYISKDGGIMRGGIIGVICGMACSIQYASVFALCGLAAGMLWKISSIVAIAAACIVGIATGLYLEGFTSLRIFAPDLMAASVLFTPLVQFGVLPKLSMFSNSVTVPDSAAKVAVIAEDAQKNTVTRLESLSSAMCDLSEVFYNLSDRLRRPGIYDVKQLCDKTFDGHCRNCGMYGVCWDKEYSSTVDVMNKIYKSMITVGRMEVGQIPDYVTDRCPNIDKVVTDLNTAHAELLENTLKRDKTEVFAMDYEAMSKLLETTLADNESEYLIDEELCKKLKNTARYIDFHANNIAAYGKRRKNILAGGVDLSRVKLSSDEIRNAFEKVSGVTLTVPEFMIDKDYVTMSMRSAKRYQMFAAKASDIKDTETVNGDIISVFENEEDYFYTLISDGMGSGREAAITSKIASIFMEKLLNGGNNKAVTLEMLNNFIRCKNMESFATVDLLEIDMLSGQASFIKSGAAPSYILRDGSLFKITSNSMPIGIAREINAEEIKFELREGDIIVMMSDGVAQSFEDSIWLANMLTNEWEEGEGLQSMSEKILTGAKEHNKRSDDMTVGLIKVMAA